MNQQNNDNIIIIEKNTSKNNNEIDNEIIISKENEIKTSKKHDRNDNEFDNKITKELKVESKLIIYANDIHEIKISESCLQGPCLHSVIFSLKSNPSKWINIPKRAVVGADILRLIVASKAKVNKRSHAHFDWFLSGSWEKSTKEDHLNKKSFIYDTMIIEYPKGYKHKELFIPKLPKPKERKTPVSDREMQRAIDRFMRTGGGGYY